MSFSAEVKAELLSNIKSEKNSHCRLSQLLAIINIYGFVRLEGFNKFVAIHIENAEILKLTQLLIKEFFEVEVKPYNNEIIIKDGVILNNMVSILGILDSNDFSLNSPIYDKIISKNCCKRAYIRTAFVCCGSINNPSKHYHLEFTDVDYDHLKALSDLIGEFGIELKAIERKKQFVAYCKEAEQIVDLLNVMSAVRSLLELENTRVIKEVRNNINRIVNCEAANINKIVSTSLRQIEDINIIKNSVGLDYLSEGLKEVALGRVMYPDASLKELGEHLSPPVGKSGVNHRLKKIHEIAKSLKI